MFEFNFARLDVRKAKKTLILFSVPGNKLLPEGMVFDQSCGGTVSKALKRGRFRSEFGQIRIIDTPALASTSEVVVVGVGPTGKLKPSSFRTLGVKLGKALDTHGISHATVILEDLPKYRLPLATAGVELVEGMHLTSYRFDRFLKENKHNEPSLEKVTVMAPPRTLRVLKAEEDRIAGLFAGVNLTRDLVNLPANIANAEYLAKEAEKLAELGVEVKILGPKELEKEGLNLLLSVNKGSAVEPRLIIMKWKGAGAKAPTRCVVGKGVTFDTGGYSIKTAMMEAMKADMAGAGAVMGLMKSLASRKSKVNVIGVCGCVENMIGPAATRPSDIVKAYNGLTVEINNTDAEGRLVLADALAYIIAKENPAEVIDIATLTGACMVALANVYAGLFSNSERMAARLLGAGEESGEELWRLPVNEAYVKMMKSPVADLTNSGPRWGGASTAAAFLSQFVGDTHWAHLDIAGVGMAEKIGGPGGDIKGASGFGVRLLTSYMEARG